MGTIDEGYVENDNGSEQLSPVIIQTKYPMMIPSPSQNHSLTAGGTTKGNCRQIKQLMRRLYCFLFFVHMQLFFILKAILMFQMKYLIDSSMNLVGYLRLTNGLQVPK